MIRQTTVLAKKLLHNTDKIFVQELLDRINMTSREKKILVDSELEKKSIKELSIEMNISTDYVTALKRSAIEKVYEYGISKELIRVQCGSDTTNKNPSSIK